MARRSSEATVKNDLLSRRAYNSFNTNKRLITKFFFFSFRQISKTKTKTLKRTQCAILPILKINLLTEEMNSRRKNALFEYVYLAHDKSSKLANNYWQVALNGLSSIFNI